MAKRRPKSPEEEYMKEVHDEEIKAEHEEWREEEEVEKEKKEERFKDYQKERIKRDYLIKSQRKKKLLGGVRGKPTRGPRGAHK